MFQFIAFEKNALAIEWSDGLCMIGVINAQLPGILALPVGIQVHDHRKNPAVVAPKLVQVALVKTAFFVQRIMKFIPGNARITSTVEVNYKIVHQIEKEILGNIFMQAIQPVNLIAAQQFILYMHCPIANARFPKLLVMVQCEQICFELNGQGFLQKMFGQADVVFQKTIDEAIELGLQTVELKSNWHKTNRVAVKVILVAHHTEYFYFTQIWRRLNRRFHTDFSALYL